MSDLSKLRSKYGDWVKDAASGMDVYHVRNPHVLVQAAGYLKHVTALGAPLAVFYRGQTKLHPELRPSLYRGIKTHHARTKREGSLKAYLDRIGREKKVMRAVPVYAHEPLLQHYGIRTKWLDLVDNIWVALWFACHSAYVSGANKEYLHFERRAVTQHPKEPEYCYILLVKAGMKGMDHGRPGIYVGDDSELVDLRVAAPSIFIRPHAQHGLLMRRTKWSSPTDMNYTHLVAGVIRVELREALEWIGAGKLLTVHSLFPPPLYDFGFGHLLENAPKGNGTIGSIQAIGA